MAFISLHVPNDSKNDNSEVVINTDHIVEIRDYDMISGANTMIRVANGTGIAVVEPMEIVLETMRRNGVARPIL